jgi:hypothetical protein
MVIFGRDGSACEPLLSTNAAASSMRAEGAGAMSDAVKRSEMAGPARRCGAAPRGWQEETCAV